LRRVKTFVNALCKGYYIVWGKFVAFIVMAEDDVGVRSFVKRALELNGHRVVAHENGLDALEYLEETSITPDLLLSDIRMPLMDGIELAKGAHALMPTMPILLMTGYADQREGAGELRAIIHDVVSKPFSLDTIRQKVNEALNS
jgi:DNA-binding NtrC family response regulator